MFNVGGGEVIVILLLALIVLGPDKLPQAAKQAGKYLGEFRRMSQGFQQEIKQAMDLEGITSVAPRHPEPARNATAPVVDPNAPAAPETHEVVDVVEVVEDAPPAEPAPVTPVPPTPDVVVEGPSGSFT